MLGVSRQRVTQLTAQPHFPHPVQELIMGKVWLRSDIETWAAKRGRQIH
jgi:predicted DNA-binding transcriptional regulator AlpA